MMLEGSEFSWSLLSEKMWMGVGERKSLGKPEEVIFSHSMAVMLKIWPQAQCSKGRIGFRGSPDSLGLLPISANFCCVTKHPKTQCLQITTPSPPSTPHLAHDSSN